MGTHSLETLLRASSVAGGKPLPLWDASECFSISIRRYCHYGSDMNTTDAHQRPGIRIENNSAQKVTDTLVAEGALQVVINGERFTITMRTPGRDRELALGLLLTEGILAADAPLPESAHTAITDLDDSAALNVIIPGFSSAGHERSLMSSAACGLCGKRDISDIALEKNALAPAPTMSIKTLPRMVQDMVDRQNLFERSGGSHAAAAFSASGEFLAFAEDVGRHNAVDKTVGQLMQDERLSDANVLLVSGRVSYEIIYKACRAGLPFVIAVSAPSALAVRTAEKQGMTLIGFCRGSRATIYSRADQITDID